MTMTDTTSTGAETPIQPAVDAPAVEFTQEQALDWLAANPNTTKRIREIAALWGWSKSTTQRFVSRFGGSDPRGTSVGQTPKTDGTSGTSGTAETPEAPIATAPDLDDFEWSPDNEDVILAPRQAIAVYRNAWNQIVIRASAEDVRDVDTFIAVSLEHLPAVVAKLTAILKESTGGGGAA